MLEIFVDLPIGHMGCFLEMAVQIKNKGRVK